MGWILEAIWYKWIKPRINQRYTVDFKLKELQSIDEDFLSLNDTCLKFNIPSSSVFLNGKEICMEGLQPKQES